MKKALFSTIIALVLVGAISLSALAVGCERGKGSIERGFPKIYRDLNLSPEQEQKILLIRQDFQKEIQPLRFEMQRKQLELRQLWAAKKLDQNAIETKDKEITGLRVQIINKARAMREKVKNTLTSEQRKQLEEARVNSKPKQFRRRGRCKEKRDCYLDA